MNDTASGGERTARRSPRRWVVDLLNNMNDNGVPVAPLLRPAPTVTFAKLPRGRWLGRDHT